jgi:ribosome maturation factor RimP
VTKSRPDLTVQLEPVVSAMGYELVGVEFEGRGRHGVLRVYIDKPNGITLADCERVSHQVSGWLDVEDPIPSHYNLEVSSPGLDRPLFKPEDYQRFVGSRVRLRVDPPLLGRRKLSGTLLGLHGDQVEIDADGDELSVPLAQVTQARLVPEL